MHILAFLSSPRRHLLTLSVAIAAMAVPGFVAAQAQFPTRPITLIVPYGPGGGPTSSREPCPTSSAKPWATDRHREPCRCHRRIGTEAVARSKPDGYTLIFGTAATHALNVSAFKSLPYHPLKDFEPVAFVGTVPVVLYAHPSMPCNPRESSRSSRPTRRSTSTAPQA